MEFCYSENIFFDIHSNFIYDSETYDVVKRYYDSFKLYLSHDSSFFSV